MKEIIYSLENSLIKVNVDSKGAELKEILDKDGINYLWTGDKKYWGRRSPVLFPIVGKLKDGKFIYDNKEYKLSQHGFARDMEFECDTVNDSCLEFTTKSDGKCQEFYPFEFVLKIKYTLQEEKIIIDYSVENVDDKIIYFSIGAHPGFNCPISEDESFEDYYIEFEKEEIGERMMLNPENGLFIENSEEYLKNEKILKLKKDLFLNDALVFKNLKSDFITIKNTKNNKEIKVDFKGFPYLGIWTQKNEAPFVCIEPWFGHADYENSNNIFEDKKGIMKLEKGKNFYCGYSIEIKS